ncbi:hypothetical protein BN2497_6661 [Janthinobacterium sp. CG23_2]|nr:hypothetical protein BN2497_6661 [Janthinobacterium sp. CG23_2]CUU29728.1 hypothetical protein BN3177_6661 [Janthinobacterium sp. CG23_2]
MGFKWFRNRIEDSVGILQRRPVCARSNGGKQISPISEFP